MPKGKARKVKRRHRASAFEIRLLFVELFGRE